MEENIDVQQETTEAPSAENQAEATTETPESTEETKVSKSIPYERFAEINSKNKLLEEKLAKIEAQLTQNRPQPQVDVAQQQQEAAIREQLKKMGFISQDEIKQMEEDRKLDSRLTSLESKYSGSDGKPKFSRIEVLEYARDHQIGDPEAAYKLMNHDALMDYAIKQATGKIKPVKSETSDGSGSSQAGTTNSDLLSAVQKGDKDSLRSFIKRML